MNDMVCYDYVNDKLFIASLPYFYEVGEKITTTNSSYFWDGKLNFKYSYKFFIIGKL